MEKYRNSPLPESLSPIVSQLVQGVLKIDNLKTKHDTLQEAQNIRNMLFALTDDIRVIFIKLAEKLHALRVMDSSPDDKRKVAARECLEIYAPIANRLGISWIKNELEYLSLKFINRETYQQIKDLISEKRDQRKELLEFVQEIIRSEAAAAGIKITVQTRAKHFYSVYMKMRKRGISAEKIYDLSGIRIICNSIENCYTLLGIVHLLWKPLDGCFKDYIVMPKPNGYQSLHTSVMLDDVGKPLEIQIRTEEMHQIAENGIASHWLYKKGSGSSLDEAIPAQNSNISGTWLQDIKRGILRSHVYVFTPQGKVIKLPAGATPIDFAYHIHSAVGEHCIGAKANGRIIPLNSQLKTAQVLEILTSSSAHPHLNWLQMAKSAKTRSKIRAWFKKYDESHNTEKTADKKKPVNTEQTFISVIPETESTIQRVIQPQISTLKVRIGEEKNLMFRFARCCNPMIGDSIIGYVSRGRGIIIHRKNCPNFANNPEVEFRKIEAEWDYVDSALIRHFSIEAKYSPNLFSEIEGAIRKQQGHIIEGRLEETDNNRLSGTFILQLKNSGNLKMILKSIRGIPGIVKVKILNADI